MSNTENTAAPKGFRKRTWIAAVAGVALLTGTVAGIAGQRGHGFMGGGHHGGFERMSEGDVERMVERFVGRASDRLDLTADQETRMTSIATAAAQEMRPLRQEMRETRREIRTLLLEGDSVDRAALEALRTARLADLDRISATMLTAAADAAEVLTPEQRAQVQERMGKRGHGHRRHDD